MNTAELKARLEGVGCSLATDDPRQWAVSTRYLRCDDYGGRPAMLIGGERRFKEQIDMLVDALHWFHARGFKGVERLCLVFGHGRHTPDLRDALATLLASYSGFPAIDVELDFWPVQLPLARPDFSLDRKGWLRKLEVRAKREPTKRARMFAARLVGPSCPNFRWYRSLSDRHWSGRVEGLEVCRVKDDDSGEFGVGKAGKKGAISDARAHFLAVMKQQKIAWRKFQLANRHHSRMAATVRLIRRLSRDREGPVDLVPGARKPFHEVEPEHRFESQILRGGQRVETQGGELLLPVFGRYPFQLPIQWSERGEARYLDVLMTELKMSPLDISIPWAVELKVPDVVGGYGEYLRHALTQAVLYREYIRMAIPFHAWLLEAGKVDATRCRGMVAIPRVRSKRRQVHERLKALKALGMSFDVEVVEIE